MPSLFFFTSASGVVRARRIINSECWRRDVHTFFAAFVAERSFPYLQAGEIEARDFELLALLFVGALNEAVTHWVVTPPADRRDIEHVIDTTTEMYLLVRRGLER